MKPTVIGWLLDSLKVLLGRSIEVTFRIVLCFLPLGVYLLLIQNRNKVSSISSLYAFTNDKSVWQHVFPGFALVAIDKDFFRNTMNKLNDNFQERVRANKYTIAMVFMTIIVALMLYSYVFK